MKYKVMLILLSLILLSYNIIVFGNTNELIENMEESNNNTTLNVDNSYSKWAEESIISAINAEIVPESIQKEYTDKITRKEFCQLAIQTYLIKTGTEINKDSDTPFIDINDIYVTVAYNMKIVSGTGNDKFSPDNNITRQEAAVMLNNLATLLNVDNGNPIMEKFVDEEYFADWAKSAIYSVAGIKSGDTYLMMGTGNNKFSPWMNYTREQAIATMWRLCNCQQSEPYYDGQYFQSLDEAEEKYGDWIYYEVGDFSKKSYSIVRLRKDGRERQVLVTNNYGIYIEAINGEYIYYIEREENLSSTSYKMKLDGSNIKKIKDEEMSIVCNSIKNKNVHNDKYQFYKAQEFYAKSDVYYLTRCDLDGNNINRLYDNWVYGVPILYDNYIYIVANYYFLDNGADTITRGIVRFDIEGNMKIITQDTDNLIINRIIKIDDNKIYYERGTRLSIDKSEDSDLIYSVNIDGTEDKLIY